MSAPAAAAVRVPGGLRARRMSPAVARFTRHRLAILGAAAVVVLLLTAIFAPDIAPRNPLYIDLVVRFTPPLHGAFVLGTDPLGRDLLSRLIYAGRISLTVGFSAMLVSAVVGTAVGTLAAYRGGAVDSVFMRVTDVGFSLPSIFLLLLLAAFIPPSVLSITLIIGLTSWMATARLVRGQILTVLKLDFIEAARAGGASDLRLVLRHLLPNSTAPVVVAATLNVADAILAESYVSFLGYGIQPPLASWGNMLNNAQSYFVSAPWLAVFPGLMITLAVTSINFIGDGLRDALDPRLKI
ncbi:MAG: ABC transporter permease [Bacillati bacterium ANGP1]|uniref:ABC transporter permease n=1 Tax=Candidatus Segetimicrobium genomatis TaxID=2569760 RepID=A0A537K2V4_9BACT|nr:MAG: ABC transporter permease [Terrabacteria group bacterium ANGP1]